MHRWRTGLSTGHSGGRIVSPKSRAKVVTKPRRTACFSRRNKGPPGSGKRREAEMKRKPSRSRKAKRTVETDSQPKAASTARSVERRSSGRSGRESRRAVEVQRRGRRERKFTEARKLGGGSADRPSGLPLTRWKRGRDVGVARSFVPLPGLARGSGQMPQTEGRFLSRLGSGRSRSAARTTEMCRTKPDSSMQIGFGPIFLRSGFVRESGALAPLAGA
jgi:hypothetical protein